MRKYERDELYLIKDFLEELREDLEYMEDLSMLDLTIEVIEKLIKRSDT